ncbi:MAG: hypothetical protein PF445_06990 [Melioribacteraceae bacterium]|jgi:hypothetical protein|nr:hypothetical protein [Melioribacteraceae bacterium]
MIKLRTQFMFLALFLLLTSKEFYSQTNAHSLGMDVGYLGSADQYSGLVIFPEVFVSGNFFTYNFNWKINMGYWDDGVKKPLFTDSPTYSYSSFVLSSELIYLLPITKLDRPSPVRLLSGFSYHYVDSKIIDNYGNWAAYSENFTGNLFYFDVGLEIHILIQRQLTLFLKGAGYFPLNNRKFLEENKWRLQLSLGINYNFKL